MLTRRFREPRSLHEKGRNSYSFLVVMTGVPREKLQRAQAIAAGRYGAVPSNPLLLDDMLQVYLEHA